MTNCPDRIRDMWADIYRLFDAHYAMANTEEAWSEYWKQTGALYEKYHDIPFMSDFINVVTAMLGKKVSGKDDENGHFPF